MSKTDGIPGNLDPLRDLELARLTDLNETQGGEIDRLKARIAELEADMDLLKSEFSTSQGPGW